MVLHARFIHVRHAVLRSAAFVASVRYWSRSLNASRPTLDYPNHAPRALYPHPLHGHTEHATRAQT